MVYALKSSHRYRNFFTLELILSIVHTKVAALLFLSQLRLYREIICQIKHIEIFIMLRINMSYSVQPNHTQQVKRIKHEPGEPKYGRQ